MSQSRFKTGDTVKTRYGTGEIVGIDCDNYRWLVKIKFLEKSHIYYFYDHEVENVR